MANEQNLIPLSKRSQRERKEIARKGAKATNELKKKRKTLREELLALLETGDYQEKISLAMIQEAKAGNTKAFEVIRDTIGEKPKDKLEVEQDKPFEVNINIKKKRRVNVLCCLLIFQYIQDIKSHFLTGGTPKKCQTSYIK